MFTVKLNLILTNKVKGQGFRVALVITFLDGAKLPGHSMCAETRPVGYPHEPRWVSFSPDTTRNLISLI